MKTSQKLIAILFFLYSLSGYSSANAQSSDSTKIKIAKDYKNAIKFNLSSVALYDKSLQFIYERVLTPHTSFTVFGGYVEFPSLGIIKDNPDVTFKTTGDKSGYSMGADYRFYLKKENKYSAPHGLYLAPYASYFNFKGQRDLTYNSDGGLENLSLNSKISFLNIGAELGYQFVIKDRFVIDAVLFGPAVSSYKFNLQLDGNISEGDHQQVVEDIFNALKDKLPLFNQLTSDEGISKNGLSTFWAGGFRYAVHIGYRF